MTARRRLPSRRASLTFDVEAQGLRFTCTASKFSDGSLAEVFFAKSQSGLNGRNQRAGRGACSLACHLKRFGER